MYVPSAFSVTDPALLRQFVEQNSFGELFSQHEGGPFASHLPMLFNPEDGPHGTLVGHMARANPQWKSLEGQQVLAVFTGPHAYISPRWYEESPVVPTWNYTAVHVTGTCRLVVEPDSLAQILIETVSNYEDGAWSIEAGDEFFQKLAAAVVGFRIEIERLEGKWKLSQNHSAERRKRVIRQLASRNDENSRELARLMEVREKLQEARPDRSE